MADSIDFYFDFSSPYAYFASTQIDALAAEVGREVNWHPILLGPLFKAMGSAPLTEIPLKGEYALRDFARTAELFQIPYVQPQPFPIGTVSAARAVLFLLQQQHSQAIPFAKALFRAYFAEQKNISDATVVIALAADYGIDTDALTAGMALESTKQLLKTEVESAMARGVFGSPFMLIDGEPFWGFDRFDHIRKRLVQA
ncbi:MAG TPA: 2-hydroxychromene-2-carboxylate isomerase [Candidimonas sp.]|nr:2-hydroxychromene-2-carboxylate isomerase [Candidimonas sp.]